MSAPGYVALVGGAEVPELAEALARRGLRGVMFTYEEQLVGRRPEGVIEVLERVDFRRPLGVIRRIVEHHRTFCFRGIVGSAEYGQIPTALAAERLGLPGPSARAVTNIREKARMRRILEEKGLGQIRYEKCGSAAAVGAFQRRVRGPIIVKPAAGTGSEGVARLDSDAGAEAAFALASDAGSGVLCEQFVEGPEVSVEGVSVGGVFHPVAVTDKRTNERFLETGHDQPSAHSASVCQEAFALASRVVAALGLRHGVSHTEMKLTTKGPVLIETHTRMGGDRIPVLTHRTTGVDLADVMVGLALGETPVIRAEATGRAACIRFLIGRAGQVSAVSIPEVLPTGVLEVRVKVKAGDLVSGRSSSPDRLGHVIATGANRTEAARAADALVRGIGVTYTDQQEEAPWLSRAAS